MNYFFLVYSLLMILSSVIPIFPKGNVHHMFFMEISPTIQNFLHIPMFAIWVILLKSPRFNIPSLLIEKRVNTLFIGLLFGILLEIVQIIIPGRYASLEDVLLNVIGIVIGLVLHGRLRRYSFKFF